MYNYPWSYPPPYYHPQIPPINPMSCTPKEFKQWLKIAKEMQKGEVDKKKEEKKEVKARVFTAIEMFLILVATSPFVAMLYKFYVIPLLLR